MRVSAYSPEANPSYPGQQSDCYFNRYVWSDSIVTVLSPGCQEPLGNARPLCCYGPCPPSSSLGEQSNFSGAPGTLYFGKGCGDQNRLWIWTVSRPDVHQTGKDCILHALVFRVLRGCYVVATTEAWRQSSSGPPSPRSVGVSASLPRTHPSCLSGCLRLQWQTVLPLCHPESRSLLLPHPAAGMRVAESAPRNTLTNGLAEALSPSRPEKANGSYAPNVFRHGSRSHSDTRTFFRSLSLFSTWGASSSIFRLKKKGSNNTHTHFVRTGLGEVTPLPCEPLGWAQSSPRETKNSSGVHDQ